MGSPRPPGSIELRSRNPLPLCSSTQTWSSTRRISRPNISSTNLSGPVAGSLNQDAAPRVAGHLIERLGLMRIALPNDQLALRSFSWDSSMSSLSALALSTGDPSSAVLAGNFGTPLGPLSLIAFFFSIPWRKYPAQVPSAATACKNSGQLGPQHRLHATMKSSALF